MKNSDVIESFLEHGRCNTLNLHSDGNKLFSYFTCIAEWKILNPPCRDYGRILLINMTKYSRSTSTIQNKLLKLVRDKGILYSLIYEVEEDTKSLSLFES